MRNTLLTLGAAAVAALGVASVNAAPVLYFTGAEIAPGNSTTGAENATANRLTTNGNNNPFDNGISFGVGPNLSYATSANFGSTGYGAHDIDIGLALGTTTLDFVAHGGASYSGESAVLTAFFSGSSGSYNPGTAGAAATPDLAVFTTPTNSAISGTGSTPSVQLSGTEVKDYNDNYGLGGGKHLISYSGATSYTVGGYNVAITGYTFATGQTSYNANYKDVGILTFNVTAVPEPASLGLVAVGALGLLLLKRRRPA